MKSTVVSALLLGTAWLTAQAADPPAVPYPQGYRAWYHLKSMVIEKGHPLYASFGGIHHIYANSKALRGYQTGHFPDGAVIVFDLLAAENAGHAITEGPRKVLGVMWRDQRKFAATGGWGFEAFKGDSRTERLVGSQAVGACFSCHLAQKGHAYVFSRLSHH